MKVVHGHIFFSFPEKTIEYEFRAYPLESHYDLLYTHARWEDTLNIRFLSMHWLHAWVLRCFLDKCSSYTCIPSMMIFPHPLPQGTSWMCMLPLLITTIHSLMHITRTTYRTIILMILRSVLTAFWRNWNRSTHLCCYFSLEVSFYTFPGHSIFVGIIFK